MSFTLSDVIEALTYLASHPLTKAQRESLPMSCPECEENGVRLPHAATSYLHGTFRWSSDIIHGAKFHGRPFPPEFLSQLPWVLKNAKAFEASSSSSTDPIQCPSCKAYMDPASQAKGNFMCYKCGYFQPTRPFSQPSIPSSHPGYAGMGPGMRAGSMAETMVTTPGRAPLNVLGPTTLPSRRNNVRQPPQNHLYAHLPEAQRNFFILLEELQASPSCQRQLIDSHVPCEKCGQNISVGRYYFGNVSWSAQLIHNVLLHGKEIPEELRKALKAYWKQRKTMSGSMPSSAPTPTQPQDYSSSHSSFAGNVPIY